MKQSELLLNASVTTVTMMEKFISNSSFHQSIKLRIYRPLEVLTYINWVGYLSHNPARFLHSYSFHK